MPYAHPVKETGAKDTTRFIDGIKVVDQKTGQVLQGAVDLGPTLDRIKSGVSFPHRNDGSIFQIAHRICRRSQPVTTLCVNRGQTTVLQNNWRENLQQNHGCSLSWPC
jgi:hypothetical protein